MRQRAVALLWGGLGFSAIGDQAYDVAFAWIATEAFGAAAGYMIALGPLGFGGRVAGLGLLGLRRHG